MAQVELILSLEEKYGVQVPPDMFGELSSAPAILDFINGGAAAERRSREGGPKAVYGRLAGNLRSTGRRY